MTDKFWDRVDKLLGIVIVVGMVAMAILLSVGVAAAVAWLIRFMF